MDRAYPALRQMFTDIRNLWFEKMGRELRNFSIELSDFLYGLKNHPTQQWHERFHSFAAGQRFQGRYMTPDSEEALLAYISQWAAMQVTTDHAVEQPETELDPSWPELSDAERTRVRGRLGLPGFYAKPFEWGDGEWEYKLGELARVAREKMLATCRELQTLGSLAQNADQLPDDGIDALEPNIARVRAAHDEYVQALIDIERTWLAYIKANWYVGWQMEQLVLKIAGDLPSRLFDLPSSKLNALARARAEVGHALDNVVKRVDTTYKVAYWTDISITILESVVGIVGAVKTAAKEAIKQGVKFSLRMAIKAAIKQAAIQGAVLVATTYGLPPLIQAAGLNPDFVFAGVVIMQGLTAFQAVRSVGDSADLNTRFNVVDNEFDPHPGRVRENLRKGSDAEQDALRGTIEDEMDADFVNERGIWDSKGPGDRGLIAEGLLGMNLPQGFPTFDRFENGVATSIKSLDTWLNSYTSQSALLGRVKTYIDKAADFKRGTRLGVVVTADMIVERRLLLAIPRDTTPTQWLALLDAIEYGKLKGVVVEYVEYLE